MALYKCGRTYCTSSTSTSSLFARELQTGFGTVLRAASVEQLSFKWDAQRSSRIFAKVGEGRFRCMAYGSIPPTPLKICQVVLEPPADHVHDRARSALSGRDHAVKSKNTRLLNRREFSGLCVALSSFVISPGASALDAATFRRHLHQRVSKVS